MTEENKCKHEWRQRLINFEEEDSNFLAVDGYYCIHCLQMVRNKEDLFRLNKFEKLND